ncbi:MAG: hypothetical protein GY754_40835 [bacterium]|nr:hypothetical protein [bacterium]
MKKLLALIIILYSVNAHADIKNGLLKAVRNKNHGEIRSLLENGAGTDARMIDGSSSLHIAAMQDDIISVKLLLKYGSNPNARQYNDATPLHLASSLSITRLLIQKGASMTARTHNGIVPLHAASYKGHYGPVKILIENGANVNITDNRQGTPLHYALMGKNELVARFLIQHGANVNARDIRGMRPLYIASWDMFLYLLDHGASLKSGKLDYPFPDPLIFSIKHKKDRFAIELIKRGAAIQAARNRGDSPLLCSIQYGQDRVSRFLIEKGAEIDVLYANATPLTAAIERKNTYIIRMLIKHGADINLHGKDGYSPLTTALKKKNFPLAQLLIKKGANLVSERLPFKQAIRNIRREYWQHFNDSLLLQNLKMNSYHSDEKNKYRVLNFLLQSGSRKSSLWMLSRMPAIDWSRDDTQKTLLYAMRLGDVGPVEVLLKKGGPVKKRYNRGYTALHYASNEELASLLIKNGADVNAKTKRGVTPVFATLNKKKPNSWLIKVFIENGAEINYRPEEDFRYPLLHYAAKSNNQELVGFLLRKKADPNRYGRFGTLAYELAAGNTKVRQLLEDRTTAGKFRKELCRAISKGNIEEVKTLLNKGADINAPGPYIYGIDIPVDSRLDRPLHYAVSFKREKILQLLLDRGADVNSRSIFTGFTPLHIAVFENNRSFAGQLIAREANPSVQDNRGDTPLHYAVMRGTKDIIKLLIEKGASTTIKNNMKKTPFDMAADRRELKKLLWRREFLKRRKRRQAGQ